MYKLLITDDESLIRRGIKKFIDLEELNISEIYEAENGKEAIDLVKKHKPDIVLMDINMPILNGLEAAKEIKSYDSEIFVVILTGYDYFEYTQKAIRINVDDYILKPVSKKDIEYILKSAIDKIVEKKKRKALNSAEISSEIELNDNFKLVKDYLGKNIFEYDLSLNKMADDIGYSSTYLSVLFKQIYNMPFQDYVNKIRMEQAKILLLSTDLRNQQIAENIGIEDVNYFITKFKKMYNITPKQFRQGE